MNSFHRRHIPFCVGVFHSHVCTKATTAVLCQAQCIQELIIPADRIMLLEMNGNIYLPPAQDLSVCLCSRAPSGLHIFL